MVSMDFKYGRERMVSTPEHPFMVRRRGSEYRGRSLVKRYSEPLWCNAGDIRRGDLVLEPFQVDGVRPDVPQVNVYGGTRVGMVGRKAEVDEERLGFAWVVGLYLAEGHLRGREPDGIRKGPTRREVVFSLNAKEVDGFKDRIEKCGWTSVKSRNGESVFRLSVSDLDLWAAMGWFGKGASNKVIPEWCHAMTVEWQAQLLDAYFKGDGYEHVVPRSGAVSMNAATVSRRLAFGIARMVARVHGVVASVKRVAGPRKMLIQGRLVSCKETWTVRWRRGGFGRIRPGMVDGLGSWIPVAGVRKVEVDARKVYNLSVTPQETYVAGGFAVHNCSTFSMAGVREDAWGQEKKFREGQAEQVLSDLFFDYLTWWRS
jgi:intein/homing endonuclease